MRITKNRKTVHAFFMVLTFCFVFQVALVFAGDIPTKERVPNVSVEDMGNNPHIKVFNPETLSNPELCEYVDEGNRLRVPEGRPKVFGSVKDIYIFNSIEADFDGSYQQKLDENKLPHDVIRKDRYRQTAEIAGCILYNHVGKYKYPEKFGEFIYTTKASRYYIHDTDKAGNLSVIMSGHKIRARAFKRYKKYATENTQAFDHAFFILKILFYRPDVTIDNIHNNVCSSVFPYTEDKDLFKRMITGALQGCLTREFWN